jgi:hypothetical protein
LIRVDERLGFETVVGGVPVVFVGLQVGLGYLLARFLDKLLNRVNRRLLLDKLVGLDVA